ncbi:MAG: hypothetical protein HQL44_09300 [Alphaproteobacteria bacterium]|nr:hypothetical protein [Alphaproteobacteria bacterium]
MMSSKAEKAFEIRYQRAATDAERLRLVRIKDALGLSDDDPIWLIFIALGHYQALYEAIPARIEEAAKRASAFQHKRGLRFTLRDLIAAVALTCVVIGGAALGLHQMNSERIAWADIGISSLTDVQLQRLGMIIREAPYWSQVAGNNGASWPCISEQQADSRFTIGGRSTHTCTIGIGNLKP